MFFKNVLNHARDLFQKSPDIANNMFQKARAITTDISRGAGDASRILGQVGGIAQDILNSGTAREIMGLDPRLQRAGRYLQKGVNGINLASGLSGQLSDFSNERTYRGRHDDNILNAIERARNIRNDANVVNFI